MKSRLLFPLTLVVFLAGQACDTPAGQNGDPGVAVATIMLLVTDSAAVPIQGAAITLDVIVQGERLNTLQAVSDAQGAFGFDMNTDYTDSSSLIRVTVDPPDHLNTLGSAVEEVPVLFWLEGGPRRDTARVTVVLR